MAYNIRNADDHDRDGVVAVFNYFVDNSFAAYPTTRVDGAFFDRLRSLGAGFPFLVVESAKRDIVGFAQLRPHHPADSLKRTGEITYFILPEYTGQGIGARLLEQLTAEARSRNVDTLLGSISSLNEGSLRFHLQHGFVECGRFRRVGCKQGRDFDIVWVQKFI